MHTSSLSVAQSIAVIAAALFGVAIAIYRLVIRPKIQYSIETPSSPYFITTSNSPKAQNEAAVVRIIRVRNASKLAHPANNVVIHVRTSAQIQDWITRGIYPNIVNVNDAQNARRDLTARFETLPPGGKFEIEIRCFKKDIKEGTNFFQDHSVIASTGHAKKVASIRNFAQLAPIE
ncbi:MAG: hypothetical protein ACTSWQ_10480 [Candidatus Thorarchaeota archaeon]